MHTHAGLLQPSEVECSVVMWRAAAAAARSSILFVKMNVTPANHLSLLLKCRPPALLPGEARLAVCARIGAGHRTLR